MKIISRLGKGCACGETCPAVFLTDTGDVAVIGSIAPAETVLTLPDGSGIGDGERMVIVPRSVIIEAGWTPPAV